MFDFLSLKKTLANFAGELGGLRSQIEILQRQREDIVNAPATREDVKAMVEKWAAGKSAEYVKQLQFNMQEFVTKPEHLLNAQTIENRMTLFGKSRQLGGLGMFPGPELDDRAICCLMGPALITSLHAAIDAMENWPKGSIPMSGRAKKISDLDNKIDELSQKESVLVNAAKDAGVRVG
ncbi:hypothetical protein [Rhodoferax sp.]|uniref:hypothetical protein n=1 Tax=Rhodoferax sp. TaxID=50421 RepID=UPI002728E4CB|nr:hypothetical protein [Rhodoferax sp.]MDO8320609.1 hypothetical protein [Rhodoferax sp.]